MEGVQILFSLIASFKNAHDQAKHNKMILDLLREHVELTNSCLQEIRERRVELQISCFCNLKRVLRDCVVLVEKHTNVDRKGVVKRLLAYLKETLMAHQVLADVQLLTQRLDMYLHRLQQGLGLQILQQVQDLPKTVPKEALERDEKQNEIFLRLEEAQSNGRAEPPLRELMRGPQEPMAWNLDAADITWVMDGDQRAVIGDGSMGLVYKARWRDLEVAVKELPVGQDILQPDSYSEFVAEVQFFSRIAHPNVIRLHGARLDAQPYMMVLERATAGNLGSLRPGAPGAPASWVARTQLLLDAARGLAHLHKFRVAHRNLKASDLLAFADAGTISGYTIKVSDFGLVTTRTKTRMITRGPNGGPSSALSPPEFSEGTTLGVRSDVFAFGVVMYEFAGRRPPATRFAPGAFRPMGQQELEKYFRVAEACPPALRQLMGDCCAVNPHGRPSMVSVVGRLKRLAGVLIRDALER
ncbi:unnamed protein product [Ostreobium quekettii]|uniref:Protein kinase domain-containing protein n=1 Tax=Ostreobium quekettii TaxID=121088 RepID=A0A8S1J9L6_9CHLO|nr:unnamed protein product [Ostreobium quekettii]|eukprot:evm.model.scf_1890.3 EVM.evm.TU.scf_1890.3   scf_1890:15090-16808(+)